MSTYTCPHCGQHDLSTQRRHNCPEPPSLSIPLGPPRSMDPCANEYIARLTRELEEARRERSAARAEAMTAQASLRRAKRELEAARERERSLRDDLTEAIGHLAALVDLYRDGYPEHSDRAARLVSAAEIYLESPSREQEVGAATAEIADCRCAPAAPWRSDGATCPDWPGCGNPDWRPATPQEVNDV